MKPVYNKKIKNIIKRIKSYSLFPQTLKVDNVGKGFDRALYSTYISFMPTKNINQKLICHVDDRGKFVEMLKTSNAGQISYFTIKPGIIRGSHYHHTKTEKFLVVHGKAIMSFRNIFSNETFNLSLDSSIPEVVDTIPGWIHDIKNIGKDDAIVLVWANEEFDKSKPDTIAKKYNE